MKNNNFSIRKVINKRYSKIFETALLDEISEIGIHKKIKKGQMLVDIDDEMTHIPLIINGVIKITREDENSDEILLYFLESGNTCAISFANCIHRSKSIFRGTAEKDTECIMIPVNKIEGWLIKYKTWRVFIIDSYNVRLLEMVEAIENLAFKKLDERLIDYLTNEVKVMQNNDLSITHQEIAADLHTSRVVVSRILKKLEKKGKIKLGRQIITVTHL